MLMKTLRPTLRNDQSGFSAIVIALVLILVLSLTTVGFAQLMRREQRSALDKQLSRQAYYAAETGINDAAKAINAGFAVAKTGCKQYSDADISALPDSSKAGAAFLKNSAVSGQTATSYPCLTIDPNPKFLQYDSVNTDQSKAVQFGGADPTDPTIPRNIYSLLISWEDNPTSDSYRGTGLKTFTPSGQWTYAPVLRVGLTPLAAGSIDRNSLINSTMAAFLYPDQAGSAQTTFANYNQYSAGSYSGKGFAGGIFSGLNGNCNKDSHPRRCNVLITGLNQTHYLLDMRSIYKPSAVTVTAYDSNNVQLRLSNAQVVIDSTGKAQDVLRRVQARIPAHNTYDRPDFSLETTGNICKQLQLAPDTTDDSGNTINVSKSDCNP